MAEPVTPLDETEKFLAWLRGEGYERVDLLGGDRWVGIKRLLFHWTMHIGMIGDTVGYDDRYCYQTLDLAGRGLDEWRSRGFEGEPTGWHRHPRTGRRRPGGDASAEYVNP